MAEQGGYRRPSKQQSFSGVGKNSRRTDKQAIKNPSIQDSTELQVNDGERIRQGQQIAPLGRAPSPALSAPPRGGTPSPAAGAGAGLPDYLVDMPTKRPDEPLTSGMDIGPGSGADILGIPPETEDIRIVALERYARELNNPTAQRYLDKIYRPAPTTETVAPQMEPTMTTEEVPMEDDFADEEMGEEDTEAPTLA